MLDGGCRVFLELNGSPRYCERPVGDEMRARGLLPDQGVTLCCMRVAPEQASAEVQLLAAVCRVWCAGAHVDWARFYRGRADPPAAASRAPRPGSPPAARL